MWSAILVTRGHERSSIIHRDDAATWKSKPASRHVISNPLQLDGFFVAALDEDCGAIGFWIGSAGLLLLDFHEFHF